MRQGDWSRFPKWAGADWLESRDAAHACELPVASDFQLSKHTRKQHQRVRLEAFGGYVAYGATSAAFTRGESAVYYAAEWLEFCLLSTPAT